MIHKNIPLSKEGDIYLTTYALNSSNQYQVGKLRPAVVICPGGGYGYTADREAEPVALKYLSRGFHAFVLRYSCDTKALYPQPLLDLAKAMATVRENAEKWFVDKDKIVVAGFSAGAHLVSMLATNWDKNWLHEKTGLTGEMIKPNATVMGYGAYDIHEDENENIELLRKEDLELKRSINRRLYGVDVPTQEQKDRLCSIKHISESTPPAFLWHTMEDELVPVNNALRYASALNNLKIPFELHIFQKGPHGLSISDETVERGPDFINPHVAKWHEMSIKWLKDILPDE
jgi:acetyl esterase/lipase